RRAARAHRRHQRRTAGAAGQRRRGEGAVRRPGRGHRAPAERGGAGRRAHAFVAPQAGPSRGRRRAGRPGDAVAAPPRGLTGRYSEGTRTGRRHRPAERAPCTAALTGSSAHRPSTATGRPPATDRAPAAHHRPAWPLANRPSTDRAARARNDRAHTHAPAPEVARPPTAWRDEGEPPDTLMV